MSSSALLLSNFLPWLAVAPRRTSCNPVTTGTGVVTALGANTNAAGGVALVSTVPPTAGDFVKWAAGGLVDGGAGSGGATITAGTTATSGRTAGQILYSDGSLVRGSGNPDAALEIGVGAYLLPPSITAPNIIGFSSVGNTGGWGVSISPLGYVSVTGGYGFGAGGYPSTTANAFFGSFATASISFYDYASLTTSTNFRVYNTLTDGNNGEYGALDWQTTANVLLMGAQANGTGTLRPVQLVGSNIRVPSLTSIGAKPTVTGAGGTCAAGTTVGGALAGTFQTSAVCAAGNTVALTGMPATATGYACDATDRTLPAALIQQTASTTTGATFTVAGSSTAASNVISWKCMGY